MKITLISTSTYPSDQGLRTISSLLKKNNYNVKLIFLPEEEDYSKKYSKKVLSQLKNLCRNSDLIGISAYASTSLRAKQAIDYLKSLNKPIVWGGVHATICPQDCFNEVAIVCRGEGEYAMLELAEAIKNKKQIRQIKNLWVRENNKEYKNEPRQLIENLDELPHADYSLENHYILEKNKIIPFKEKHLNGQIFFQNIRGCPHQCTYCSNRLIRNLYKGKGKNIRAHSVDYTIEELKNLKQKFKTLKYFDIRAETLFILPLNEIKDFCEKYKKEINLRFKCLADPLTMDEEKLKLFIEAGLTDIIVGIQGSENVNYNIYKRYIKETQIIRCAEIINKHKNEISVMYDVMTSNPYETKQDILDLINLLIKLPKPYFLSVNNLVFFLGTEIYDKAIKDGIIKTKKDTAFNLNYWDRFKHIKLKKKNEYLTLILNLMRGSVTKKRYGLIPTPILKFLLTEKIITFNLKPKQLTYLAGYLVQLMDLFREKIAKRIYRKMPTNFKTWYDKVRYKV